VGCDLRRELPSPWGPSSVKALQAWDAPADVVGVSGARLQPLCSLGGWSRGTPLPSHPLLSLLPSWAEPVIR